jgi:AraC family transcriptional regulator
MADEHTEQEYRHRTRAVVDYILGNLQSDLSLHTLSGVASYSPFHLQKVFKHVTGESPKQYIIRMRLETALHLLIIHPQKSIGEIAFDCGFSSPAVFSRAVKNYFRITPEELRALSPKERIRLFQQRGLKLPQPAEFHAERVVNEIPVQVKKVSAMQGIYLTAPFDDAVKIQRSFEQVLQVAEMNSLLLPGAALFGIISPHQGNVYKACAVIRAGRPLPAKLKTVEIEAGRYAAFTVTSHREETVRAMQSFFHRWLPESGYRIGDPFGFETFSGDPSATPYEQLKREICIPVEPV